MWIAAGSSIPPISRLNKTSISLSRTECRVHDDKQCTHGPRRRDDFANLLPARRCRESCRRSLACNSSPVQQQHANDDDDEVLIGPIPIHYLAANKRRRERQEAKTTPRIDQSSFLLLTYGRASPTQSQISLLWTAAQKIWPSAATNTWTKKFQARLSPNFGFLMAGCFVSTTVERGGFSGGQGLIVWRGVHYELHLLLRSLRACAPRYLHCQTVIGMAICYLAPWPFPFPPPPPFFGREPHFQFGLARGGRKKRVANVAVEGREEGLLLLSSKKLHTGIYPWRPR